MKSSVLKFADDTKVYGNVLTSPGKLDKAWDPEERSKDSVYIVWQMAKEFQYWIKQAIINWKKKVILSLYKTLVHPHLEYSIHAWRPHLARKKRQ